MAGRRKDSAAAVIKIKPKQSEEAKRASAARLNAAKDKSIKARWDRQHGERCKLPMVKAESYVQMDCGCIVKVVNYTKTREGSVRPLVVVENGACDRVATDVECRLINGDKAVPGIWRRRTPGYKSHTIGTVFYDIGQEVTFIDKEKLLAAWKEDLKNAD